jgi:hypothetical protein
MHHKGLARVAIHKVDEENDNDGGKS